jgi:ABC-type tungstate transport system substrate-binding protein
MRPVRHNLKAIREKPQTDDKEKLSEYGRALIVNIKMVGDHIQQHTRNLTTSIREKRKKHLWYILLSMFLI